MNDRWEDFAAADPDLAVFAAARLDGQVAYLATVRADGTARVHPVTPIIGGGGLYLFMEPTSPKGRDLRRGSGYALHAAVADNNGGGGELAVRGGATLVDDPAVRAIVTRAASYAPTDRNILFELSVTGAASTVYDAAGSPVRRRWGLP